MNEPTEETQPRHPIRAVALRTGLKPDVLRVWERRYGVVEPTRSDGGQRLYTDADIERLSLLHRATAGGRSISHAATLSTAELAAVVAADEEARARSRAVAERGRGDGGGAEHLQAAWMAVTDLAPARLEGALRHAFYSEGGARLIEQVLAPLLERVGREWEAGRLSPAHEHAASVVVRRLLDTMVAELASRAGERVILVAGPSGERHEFGALLVGATAAAEGWRVVYLGGDLPAEDIVRAARESGAELVALSVVHVKQMPKVGADVTAVAAALRGQARVIVGGRAVGHLAPYLQGAEVVDDLAALRLLLTPS
jgi:methanogenic corrinoid protein MtbC1